MVKITIKKADIEESGGSEGSEEEEEVEFIDNLFMATQAYIFLSSPIFKFFFLYPFILPVGHPHRKKNSYLSFYGHPPLNIVFCIIYIYIFLWRHFRSEALLCTLHMFVLHLEKPQKAPLLELFFSSFFFLSGPVFPPPPA